MPAVLFVTPIPTEPCSIPSLMSKAIPNGSIELVSIRLFTMPVEITGLRLFHVVKSFAAND